MIYLRLDFLINADLKLTTYYLMRFLLSIFLVGLLICFNNNTSAQNISSPISGKIISEKNQPVEVATVVLIKSADSSIVKSGITDKKGEFHLKNVSPGNYLLLIRALGYIKSYTGPYQLESGKLFNVPDITLKAETKQLKEIQVVSSKPEIETRAGKVILNVQNSILADGNSAYEILSRAQGVHVIGSEIRILAGQKAMIMIDGKPTNLSGDDLVGMLKGVQSNTIDRIELITSGSSKYDAAGGGVINIISKKGKNIGTNISVNATAGYGTYYKSNIGLSFNERTEKFNVFGNYNYTNNKQFHDFTTDRFVNFDQQTSEYQIDYRAKQVYQSNTYSIGTDFFLSPKHNIGFLINGSDEDSKFTKNNALRIYNQSVLDSTVNAFSNLSRHIGRMNFNLNYKGTLDKAGKTLAADLDFNMYHRASAEYITNKFYNPNGNTLRPDSLLENISPSTIHSWLAKIDFTDPINKNSKLEAGLKYSTTKSENNFIFGPKENGIFVSDPAFSNYFIYTENINAAYINWVNTIGKFEITTGLRGEQTIADRNSVTSNNSVKDNYLDLFPQALITYNASEKNVFSLSYNRGIRRPEYQLINPFLYYVDLYDFGSGNQFLKPEYTNSAELSYNYDQKYLFTLYTHIVSDAYEFLNYQQNDTTKVNVNKPINIGTIYNYGISISVPIEFTKWWQSDNSIDASYQRYVAYPQNGNLNKGGQDIILSSSQKFTISKTVTAVLDARYESPTFYGISSFDAVYTLSGGVSAKILAGRGSLKLNASDIFNTEIYKQKINYQNLNLQFNEKVESQVVKLTFTYRFGKITLKSAAAHHPGNEDEQRRTKETH